MKGTIIKYGILSGVIAAALLLATTLLTNKIGYSYGETISYIGTVLSFLPIFLGVRKFRDTLNGGYINFGRAVALCMAAALIANLFSVGAYLYIYYTMPEVTNKYMEYAISQMKAAGNTQKDIDAILKSAQHMKEVYANPWLNGLNAYARQLFTSLLFSLVSALLIKKKAPTLGLN